MPQLGSDAAAAFCLYRRYLYKLQQQPSEMRATEVEMLFQRLRSSVNSWLTSKGLALYVFADSTLKSMAQRPQTLVEFSKISE